jgi:hypothetical protein
MGIRQAQRQAAQPDTDPAWTALIKEGYSSGAYTTRGTPSQPCSPSSPPFGTKCLRRATEGSTPGGDMFREGWRVAVADLTRVCAFQPYVFADNAAERVEDVKA